MYVFISCGVWPGSIKTSVPIIGTFVAELWVIAGEAKQMKKIIEVARMKIAEDVLFTRLRFKEAESLSIQW